jgi:hypothetical protein
MKRDGSRFALEQIKKTLDNWETLAMAFNGKMDLRQRVYSDRGFLEQALDYTGRDTMYTCLLFWEVDIPYKGGTISISSSEVKTPIFTYKLKPGDKSFFSIRREDWMDSISKLFGDEELQLNDKAFDKQNYLETDNKTLLANFLDVKIRDWLGDINMAYLDYNSPKSERALSLYCSINETDKQSIERTIKMFQYCIDKLSMVKKEVHI